MHVRSLTCIVLYYYTAIKVYQISLKKKHDVGVIGRNSPISANHQNNKVKRTNIYHLFNVFQIMLYKCSKAA